MSQDTGLIKRGLFLLVLMSALVVVVLLAVFQRTSATLPASADRPELLSATLIRSNTGFPGAVDWLNFFQLTQAFPSAEGWKIRYNAAGALARRGSTNVPWDIFLEMLDEKHQMKNFHVQLQDGTVVPDETAARMTMIYALRGIADWHKKQEAGHKEVTPELARVYAAVDQLSAHPVMEIKTQAENTRKVFYR